jgi:serine/threonine-protein kinase
VVAVAALALVGLLLLGLPVAFLARSAATAPQATVPELVGKRIGEVPGVLEQACITEARAAAALAHPNIAQIFDSSVHEGHGFIVMELVPGRTLRAILDERRVLPPGEAIELAAQLADALDCAHRHGVIHCDVKPPNIIVTPDGRPKLVDFGIARAMAATTRQTDEVWGSAPYMAPEQVEGLRPDGRTDLYALGVVLYELLTGRLPFEGTTLASVAAQRLVKDPPPLRQHNPRVAPALERVVLRALARERSERYARASDLQDGLRGVAEQAGARTGPLHADPTPTRPRPAAPTVVPRKVARRPPSVVAVAALALVGLLLGLPVAFLARSAATTPQATVPELVGKRIGEVPASLEQANLQAGSIQTRPADPPEVGRVLEQRPGAGQTTASGGEVELVVGVPR